MTRLLGSCPDCGAPVYGLTGPECVQVVALCHCGPLPSPQILYRQLGEPMPFADSVHPQIVAACTYLERLVHA